MGMTVAEKILARASARPSVAAGDVVEPRVDLAMSHENAALVISQFQKVFEVTGAGAAGLGPVENRHHLRSSRPGGEREDGHESETHPRIRGRAGHLEVS